MDGSKQSNKRVYLSRALYSGPEKDRPKGSAPAPHVLDKAISLAKQWHEGPLGKHYRDGTTPPLNVLALDCEEVCEVTPVPKSKPGETWVYFCLTIKSLQVVFRLLQVALLTAPPHPYTQPCLRSRSATSR